MSRKIVRLTLDHLDVLEAPCRSCLFWELDPVRRARVDDAAAEKDGWASEVLREWGSCGRVALVDDVPVGHLFYAPEAFVPGAAGFPTAPVSPDAVLLTAAYVDPEHRGGGLGRMLVQAMAADLIKRGGSGAVEAFGDTTGRSAGCVLPADFLSSVGFKTHRAHPTTPRMRMDLRTSVRWRTEVDAAIERLVGALRPAPKSTRASRSAR
ncbi:GNAT family N-acetyltransferase [Nocardioides mangrovi]|uniref:GNAT family N-acetyltransferase n=1 Tax=Nocardioides mangrovi TaxID=2874580 RepID=A0ABS7UBZ0_9ACTN|nr:GNAT family N-acetyltransferase [Nocardioides mangrovi]MBZ5738178.1 GNAT family N-acetyltransferase [Nocardioides mangrovi]